jgi:hypothetical protein
LVQNISLFLKSFTEVPMRTVLVIFAAVLVSQLGLAQGGRGRGGGRGPGEAAVPPPAPPKPGFECFAQAVTPEFPKAALQAKVDGTVYAFIQVSPQGTADKIDFDVASSWQNGKMLLTPPVEKALRESKYKTDCAGKTVAVVYRYSLYGEPIAMPKVTTRTEGNIVFLESQPEKK